VLLKHATWEVLPENLLPSCCCHTLLRRLQVWAGQQLNNILPKSEIPAATAINHIHAKIMDVVIAVSS